MSNNFKIVIAGDIMPAETNVDLFEKGDVETLYGDEILSIFNQADYSIANLEGAITDSNNVQSKEGPVIKSSTKSVKGIKGLGLKAVALANNHITDFSQEGCLDTLKTLNNEGIEYVGVGTLNDMKTHLSLTFGNSKVCIYNVSETFFNESTNDLIGANQYDEYLVCNEIKQLKQCHDYLIVLYHGGAEYFQYPTPLVRKRCHRMSDCGADVIVTQHTHCIGCEEIYNNTYILHGQGNFFFARQKKRPDLTMHGILLQLNITENGINIDKFLVSVLDKTIVRLDEKQDFSSFIERSDFVINEDQISVMYTKEKLDEISSKYLFAFKGKSFYWKMVKKYMPSKIKEKLINSYSKKNLLTILNVLHHTRRNESMTYIIEYLINNIK